MLLGPGPGVYPVPTPPGSSPIKLPPAVKIEGGKVTVEEEPPEEDSEDEDPTESEPETSKTESSSSEEVKATVVVNTIVSWLLLHCVVKPPLTGVLGRHAC